MPAAITEAESERETEQLATAVQDAFDADDPRALAVALEQALAHPCAHHAFDVPGTYRELGRALREVDELDRAIAAYMRALSHGYRASPDVRAEIAVCHLAAGREIEAAARFASLHAAQPTDARLAALAGDAFAAAGDHQSALGYLTPGLEQALGAEGAPELVAHLADARATAERSLGTAPDALDARAVSWLKEHSTGRRRARRTQRGVPVERYVGDEPPATACAHCGFEPGGATSDDERLAPVRAFVEGAPGDRIVLALAWFPASEWHAAIARWPDLAERIGSVDHLAYCRRMQVDLETLASVAPGRRLVVSPVHLEHYLSWCATREHEPDDAETRAAFASEVERAGEAIAWPPARNALCWCGSGKKYKQCCATASAADGAAVGAAAGDAPATGPGPTAGEG